MWKGTTDKQMEDDDFVVIENDLSYEHDLSPLPLKIFLCSCQDLDQSRSLIAKILAMKSVKSRSRKNRIGVEICRWKESFQTVSSCGRINCSAFILYNHVEGSSEMKGMKNREHFSPDSLYIIVWDLAIHNHKLNRIMNEATSSSSGFNDDDDDSYDDDDDSYDEYNPEHLTLLKNKENTIIRDIEDNVLYWIDVISEPNFSGCAIMPIILHSASIDKQETSYRVNLLHKCLQDHRNRAQARRQSLPMFALGENDKIPIVSLLSADDDSSGSISRDNITTAINHHSVDELRRAILNITSIEHSNKTGIFKHLYAPMTPLKLAVKDILATFREMKQKVVRFDDIYVALSRNPPVGDLFSKDVVQEALAFLSTIGEVVYFGDQAPLCADPVLLKQYVVLDPRWLSFAIGCVLEPSEIKDIRDKDAVSGFGSIYSNHDDDPFESLSIRPFEAVEIWESKPQISSQCALTDDSDSQAGQLYMFLQQVCEHNGIFMPIADYVSNRDFYVLPRVVAEPLDSGSPWTFKTRENHKTVICHSWVMGGNLPPSFMDEITQGVLTVLNDMYKDSKTDDADSRHGRAQGIYVEQVLCYKTAIYMKIVEISFSYKTKEMVSSIAEIYVHLANVDSPNCVGVKTMRSSDRKLILCGKGFAGNNGAKIWTLGYEAIRKAVDWAVKGKLNDVFTREVGCPECLLTKDPRDAAMWKEASVLIAGNECILCSNQAQVHRVDPRILRGDTFTSWHNLEEAFLDFKIMSNVNECFVRSKDDIQLPPSCLLRKGYDVVDIDNTTPINPRYAQSQMSSKKLKDIVDIRPSVVLVGIWDTKQGLITSLGSGFIADTQRGLIITAGHTFYHFEADKSIGPKYHGIDGARAIIGVYDSSTESALFQYTADIVTEDLENVDACVLRLKSKFESPLKADGNRISYPQAEVGIFNPKVDGLRRLGMTDKVELESSVRMIGYDQEVENNIYSNACHSAGRIIMKTRLDMHSTQFDSSDANIRYHCPSLWIKAHLRTRHGHSGGPVVNDAGLVIGIVSSADHEEEELCYLAPSKLLYSLLKKARKKISNLANAQSQL